MTGTERLVVGVTGSSGPHFGIAVLEALRDLDVETHLILSRAARTTIEIETGRSWRDVEALADVVHAPNNLAAAVASGSFRTRGMVIVPCSMKTLAAVANGYEDGLLARAAAVTLKEGRRLVLVPRETPLALPHLRNLVSAAESGAVILPPMPGFYHRPESIDDLIRHIAGKVLDQFDLEHDLFRRWQGRP
jgi:polyprenyl P-hydroxybenzoate/phenylacrylic acid decarboxylase-like protein